MKMLRTALAIAGISAASSGAYGQAAFEFRGVPMGASEKQFLEVNPDYECSAMPDKFLPLADRGCRLKYKADAAARDFGGARAEGINADFYDDHLARGTVRFKPGEFTQIAGALKVKFGAPTESREEEFLTKGGLKGTNQIIAWSFPDGRIEIQRYAGSIDSGRLTFETKEGAATLQARSKAGVQAGASKL